MVVGKLMTLKEILEEAQLHVKNAPKWLRHIYALNDALDERRRVQP